MKDPKGQIEDQASSLWETIKSKKAMLVLVLLFGVFVLFGVVTGLFTADDVPPMDVAPAEVVVPEPAEPDSI